MPQYPDALIKSAQCSVQVGAVACAAILAFAVPARAERAPLVTTEKAFTAGQTKVCARFFIGKDANQSAQKAGVPAAAIAKMDVYLQTLAKGSAHPTDSIQMSYTIDHPGHLAQWTGVSALVWVGKDAFEKKCA